MNDLESRIRDAFRGQEGHAPRFDLSEARHVAGRTRRRQILNAAGAGIGALAVVAALTSGLGGLVRADRTVTPGATPDPATTETTQAVGASFTSPDGEVSVSLPRRWEEPLWSPTPAAEAVGADVWFGILWPGPRFNVDVGNIGLVDPVAYDAWCAKKGGSPLLTAPADAAAITRKIISDPDFETTAPVAARVGGVDAVSIDVELAPGGETCGIGMIEIARWIHALWVPSSRLRLYLVDLPEGMSVRTMAITVSAPKGRFDEFIEKTAPIIESIQFHPRTSVTPSDVP